MSPRKFSVGLLTALIYTMAGSTGLTAEDASRSQRMDILPVPTQARSCRIFLSPPATDDVKITRTFFDDFGQHPLAGNRWTPHHRGSARWPEKLYWGGKNSDVKRKNAGNGEQQIYVDPRYRGLAAKPLGLDPFSVDANGLKIEAKRMEERFKKDLFGNKYTSGILTTSPQFSQKYGYFEIDAKIPFGQGVWPAFWLLPESDQWPPEIDVFEARGSMPGVLAMTVHSRDAAGKHQRCGKDIHVPDAATKFHRYGVLWTPQRITFYLDRQPVVEAPTPPGLDTPMYMILNLAMGSKMHGVGQVGPASPEKVSLHIKEVAVYKLQGE